LSANGQTVHPTYKHLEDRIRLGGLSLRQWAQLLVCAVAAYSLSRLLPLPGSWSVSIAVTVCGLPAAGAIAFMSADFDVIAWMRVALQWRRAPKCYVGSAVVGARDPIGAPAEEPAGTAFDAEALWD
jgi:hypothetical protein